MGDISDVMCKGTCKSNCYTCCPEERKIDNPIAVIETFECAVKSLQAQIERLEAELEQTRKERDEARATASMLRRTIDVYKRVVESTAALEKIMKAATGRVHVDDKGFYRGVHHDARCSLCAALSEAKEIQ